MTMMSSTDRVQESAPVDAAAVLADVYKRMVGIHASVDERLNSDTEIVPWVEKELRELMRYISASGAAPLRPSSRPAQDD